VRVASRGYWYVWLVGHLLGYARVSTAEQNPDLQVDELTAVGCFRVWTDQASGVLDRRPQLEEVLGQLRPGDTLVVWRLDRLGRSLRHLIDTVTRLDERGVGFRSLRESIDTTTAGGRLVFHLFGALAQFEREIIRDRTVAGLAAARARGRVGGRPYDHRWGTPGLPLVRGVGSVRAGDYPRPDGGGVGGGAGPGSGWWAAVEVERGAGPAGPRDV